MNFLQNIQNTLQLLTNVLQQLNKENYAQPVSILNGASVGAHTRHVIELFQQLFAGYEDANINYEHRQRDRAMETDRDHAIKRLKEISVCLNRADKPLAVQQENLQVQSTYYRELLYNLEHTVHHMAIIRIAVQHDLQVPSHFGVAASTLKYRAECAR